jgi:Mg2+ and Co2+ transporter CorA
MDVRLVSDEGIQQHPVGELERLLARDHGFVWVDIPVCDEEAARVLSETFGFQPLAIQACIERNAVPKVGAYRDHSFVVLRAPELGKGGHVHYVELDQFIGPRYLVTVHGPLNPAVTAEAAQRETRAVLGRIEAGRLRPGSPPRCPMRSSRPWQRARRRLSRAVITLPITALSSVYGMNIIVNDRTDFPLLAVVLVVMAAMSAALLRWAKRHGWW